MKYRNILYALTLVAYALFMAHSVIPHHHHKDLREAVAHEKQEHGDNHHHGHSRHTHNHDQNDHQNQKSENNHSHAGHFFFLNHGAAFELAVRTTLDEKVFNVKEKTTSSFVLREFSIQTFFLAQHLRYHPPQDDNPPISIAISIGLRAPPVHVI